MNPELELHQSVSEQLDGVASVIKAVSMIDLGLSKVWQHITIKLMECRLKDNEKEE